MVRYPDDIESIKYFALCAVAHPTPPAVYKKRTSGNIPSQKTWFSVNRTLIPIYFHSAITNCYTVLFQTNSQGSIVPVYQ